MPVRPCEDLPVKFLRSPRLPGVGLRFWRSVGPGLRVWPLTPQVAFPSQSGDPVFRPPEAGGFVQLCRLDPLPVSASPFRAPSASRSLPARWTHRRCLNVLVPVATKTLLVTESASSAETNQPPKRNSDRGWFLKLAFARFSALRLVSLSQSSGCDPGRGNG